MRSLLVTVIGIVLSAAGWAQTAGGRGGAATITFVANAENMTKPRVRYTGNAWQPDQGGFLVGSGRGHRLTAETPPGAGDFRLEFDLNLARADRESLVVLGAESELVIAAGGTPWRLRGRFFRAADAAITLPAPGIKPGRSFNLAIERKAGTVVISADGAAVYRGPCSDGALTSLGIDPDAGTVLLYTFSARGIFPVAEAAARSFGNYFGMQLRRPPATAQAIREPVILREAATNENSVLCRRDGTLEIYAITKPASDSVSVMRSRDGGLTWSDPEIAFPLPGRAYYAVQVLEAGDGSLHAVVHILGEGPGGYRGRLYEVYHTKRRVGAAAWSAPQRIVPGYVGSIRGFIQLARQGRLLLAVGRAIPAREQPPKTGPDFGWNDTFVYFSDDQGATWRQSPDQLSLPLQSPNVTRYGAVEPALLELRDRVWMLVRDRGGRLWESHSADGERWPALARSPFISSDSPAALLRLRDGKILLLTNACQNWTDPRSYAMGGREVLHAAISSDEGSTWHGFREILHETNLVSGGDRGTAYASAAENSAGKVVVMSGQGEGKRAILAFDPHWLEAQEARDDLSAGPTGWTQYGDEGLQVETLADSGRAVAIPLKSSGLCGALWNFPLAAAGELRVRLQVPATTRSVRLCLNDHFNRIDDKKAVDHAVFTIEGEKLGLGADARWHELNLKWQRAQGDGVLEVMVDGRNAGRIHAARPAQFGVNYLRVEFRATADEGRLRLAGAAMRIEP